VSDTIGLGPIDTLTLIADGSLEALDVLRRATGCGGTVGAGTRRAASAAAVSLRHPRRRARIEAVSIATELLQNPGG
jgi:hypothetical protein